MKAHQVSDTADLLEARIILKYRFQGDRRNQLTRLYPLGTGCEDAVMHRIKERVIDAHWGNSVIDIIVGQDRTEQLLLRLDVVRKNLLLAIII